MFFENRTPNLLYREYNKDRPLNSFFSSKRIGKCVKIYDDYFQAVNGDIDKQGWEKYCLSKIRRENLINAVDFMAAKYHIDKLDAAEYVHFRIVGQTWNGMQYELRCIKKLNEFFPNIQFKKTPYDIDEQYCTDWEAYSDKLLFGIQIKPESYVYMNSPYQIRAKENHQAQIEKYKEKFNVPHFFVYYTDGKMIQDITLFNKINTYLAMNINVHL
jgi:hypothetical protein